MTPEGHRGPSFVVVPTAYLRRVPHVGRRGGVGREAAEDRAGGWLRRRQSELPRVSKFDLEKKTATIAASVRRGGCSRRIVKQRSRTRSVPLKIIYCRHLRAELIFKLARIVALDHRENDMARMPFNRWQWTSLPPRRTSNKCLFLAIAT